MYMHPILCTPIRSRYVEATCTCSRWSASGERTHLPSSSQAISKMASNTPLDDFTSLKDIKPTENAQIEGVVVNVSPMKKGQSSPYFDAKVVDEEARIRLVGFSSSLRKRMASMEDKQQPITLENCRIKKARFSDDMEVIIKPSTKMSASPKKLDMSKVNESTTNHRNVADIDSCNNYDKVSISGKVIRVQSPVKLARGLTKQDVTLADKTGAIKVTLWQNFVGCLQDESRYELTNLNVRTYKYEKYLSVPKEGAGIHEISDIGPVAEDDLPDETTEIMGVKIVGAVVTSYNACLACNAKVVPVNQDVNKCTKCDLEQLSNSTSSQASATLHLSVGCNHLTVNAFTNVLKSIVLPGQEITSVNLLMAPPFTCVVEDNIVIAASRP